VNAEKRTMESVEYIAVVSLPTKLMDEVEIDDKDDRSQGVKIYHLSVVRELKTLSTRGDYFTMSSRFMTLGAQNTP
jgi:hypothetical protein